MSPDDDAADVPKEDAEISIGQRLDAQSQQIREAAKWLIASFAAVGAALIAGSQLSSIGKLPVCMPDSVDCARLWIAAIGAVAALLGVIGAVWTGVMLLAPSRRQPSELSSVWIKGQPAYDYFQANPGQLQGFKDIDDMEAKVDAAYATYDDVYERALAAEGKEAETLEAKAWDAAEAVKTVVRRADDVVTIANHAEYVHFFRKVALRRLIYGAGAAAIGIIAFTWAANPPEAPSNVAVRNAELSGTDLSGANLTGVDMTGARLANVDFTGADLSGAILADAELEGVIWSGTTCPDGTNSDDAAGSCENHLEP